MRRRTLILGSASGALGATAVAMWYAKWSRFPPDTDPAGAYLRIALAVSRGNVADAFAYLEEDAQHALHTIRGYATRASSAIVRDYPRALRDPALIPYRTALESADAPALWARMADDRGWVSQLRRDLSGIERIEQHGPHATVRTTRGTAYPFRRRPNGIWGLTIFTEELTSEAERMARDWQRIEQAATDYRRAEAREETLGEPDSSPVNVSRTPRSRVVP